MVAFPANNLFIKDPLGNLDYTIDWSEWLVTDTIDSVTWNVPIELTGSMESQTGTTATIFLASGSLGITYSVTCEIVTAMGRTDAREILISIQDK